jgi:hypothetical protein
MKGKGKPWFTVHVEALPAQTFEGLMEGNPFGELVARVLTRMQETNVFAILGDGRHWVIWLERDGSSVLNEELSLGPEILHIVISNMLKEGKEIWRREPRYSDVSEVVDDLRRVPGIELPKNLSFTGYPYETEIAASTFWPASLGAEMQSHLGAGKGVEVTLEILLESSYYNDIGLRLEARKPVSQPAAYVSGEGWAIRVTLGEAPEPWVRVNEAVVVGSMIAHKLGGVVTASN